VSARLPPARLRIRVDSSGTFREAGTGLAQAVHWVVEMTLFKNSSLLGKLNVYSNSAAHRMTTAIRRERQIFASPAAVVIRNTSN
jgi:hypothetical protein